MAKGAKPVADFAAKEAKDIYQRYCDKGKDAIAGGFVAGTAAGIVYTGNYTGNHIANTAGIEIPILTEISPKPSTEDQIAQLEKVNALKRESIELSKKQLELEEQIKEVPNKKGSPKQ